MPSPDSTTTTPSDDAREKARQQLQGHQDGHEDEVPTSTGDGTVALPQNEDTNNGNGKDHGEEKHEVGRHRPRKRKLYSEICKQMEFYFSDANVTKNRMMRQIVEQANSDKEGYVDLNTFLDFTKIQRLSASLAHIRKALVTSEKLELSSEGEKVRRRVPFDSNKVKSANAVEECTIYVENIPRDADHEWLERIFQAFGPVAYISLPKFKTGHHKGFAFVEFDEVDSARRCVEAYGDEGACLPSDVDPSQLRSIQTFNEEASDSQHKTASNKDEALSSNKCEATKPVKRKALEAIAADEAAAAPKRRKEKQEELSPGASDEEETLEGVEGTCNVAEVGTTSSSKSKRCRKRKKTKAKKSGEAKLESESITLKVLPKKSWRQLRNRYLNLQRTNMSKVKKQLQQEQLRAQHFKNFYQPPQYPQHPHPSEVVQESGGNLVDHILEIKLDEPAESPEVLKRKISVELAEQDEDEAMISGFIKFVDYKDNECRAFVRVNGDESFSYRAENLLKKTTQAFSFSRYLSVKEVEEYKRNVQAALKKKQKDYPRKNIRGKDRLMKAATRSTHIYFGSDDEEGVTGEGDLRKNAEVIKSEQFKK